MKTIKVAVFPAGSEIGLEICNALKFDKYIELLGLTSIRDHTEMVYPQTVMVPYYGEDNFIESLNEVLERERVDFLYPAHDDVQLFMLRRQQEIHAEIISSKLETVEITCFKRRTYEFLKQESFIPRTYASQEEVDSYPVYIKPDRGQGSRGTCKITCKGDWKKIEDPENMVITEYLPGEEITVDCFTDINGILQARSARRRIRIKSGIAVRSETMETTPEIAGIAEVLNNRLEFKGAWFFQLKKDTAGKYRLLEVAARIAGTMGLSRNTGVNYPLLTVYVHMGIQTDIIQNTYDLFVERAFISRYRLSLDYQTVYMDLDDTLILKGKVNTLLMQYLYQCIDKDRRVILLSRHRGDIRSYLKQFRIPEELFDQIIFVGDAPKSKYIEGKDAILIDDSFRERKDVWGKCGISVFGTENIECLLDWQG